MLSHQIDTKQKDGHANISQSSPLTFDDNLPSSAKHEAENNIEQIALDVESERWPRTFFFVIQKENYFLHSSLGCLFRITYSNT